VLVLLRYIVACARADSGIAAPLASLSIGDQSPLAGAALPQSGVDSLINTASADGGELGGNLVFK
jgi:hypothetical protein